MYCSNCGKPVQEAVNFCASCGTPLKKSLTPSSSNILLTINANLFRGAEAVGGKLMVYEDRLHFKSHSFNIQTGDTIINIHDISSVIPINTLGIVPNGLQIKTMQGLEFRFVVSQRKKIYQLILELIKNNH